MTSAISQHTTTNTIPQQNRPNLGDRVVTKFNEGFINLQGCEKAIMAFIVALATITATIAVGIATGSIASATIAGVATLGIAGGIGLLFAKSR